MIRSGVSTYLLEFVSFCAEAVDDLVARLFGDHFGDPTGAGTQRDYLNAILLFARDELPAATERDSRIADGDPRKRTAGRHTLDGDTMWFGWALQIEAAHLLDVAGKRRELHGLLMAGVAVGCPANFAWKGHRRTRPEYRPYDATARLLHLLGMSWVSDLDAGAAEVRALFRIREWGEDT